MTNRTEQDDLARCLAGDGEAYARIVAAHQAAIARRLRWFARDAAVLDELVQDVFVEAYFALPKFRGDGTLAAWLASIATRVGYRYWKHRNRTREFVQDETYWQTVGCRDTALSPDAAAEVLARLLDRLPPRDRLVLLLVHVEGHSLDEAARLAGWSKTMTKVQAFRARRKLKELVDRLGIHNLEQALAANWSAGPAAAEPETT